MEDRRLVYNRVDVAALTKSGTDTVVRRPIYNVNACDPKRSVPKSERSVQLQILFVVFIDMLDVGIRFGERDGFGEGVYVFGAGAQEPAVYGEFGGVVGGYRGEDALGEAGQAFAEGEGA